MKSFLSCLVCSFVLFVSTYAQSANFEGQQTGKVQFNVLMPNDVLIPFLSATIEGENFRKEIPLSADAIDDKVNVVELPAGLYQVSTRNSNYYAFQRAPFRVKAGTVRKINVFPLIRVQVQMLMADGSDKYEFAPKPKYDSFPIPNRPHASLTMLIRYDERRKRKTFLEYGSKVYEFRGSTKAVVRGVMVSYDSLTVYAEKVRLDSSNFILEAHGNVVIEDGEHRIHASDISIEFKGGFPNFIPNLNGASHDAQQQQLS